MLRSREVDEAVNDEALSVSKSDPRTHLLPRRGRAQARTPARPVRDVASAGTMALPPHVEWERHVRLVFASLPECNRSGKPSCTCEKGDDTVVKIYAVESCAGL